MNGRGYRGGMGDLPGNMLEERGEPEQQMPVGLVIPADIAGQHAAKQRADSAPVGDPRKTAYTVSVFDARPPNGIDITIDNLFHMQPPP